MFGLRLCQRCLASTQQQIIPPYQKIIPKSTLISATSHLRTFFHTSAKSPSNDKDLDIGAKSTTDLLDEATSDSKEERPEFPSDYESHPKVEKPFRRQTQSRHAYRPNVDPQSTTIFLFPGQGSQFVGMGRELLDVPGVEELYSTASDILGYDLLDVCINGPIDKLSQTIHCQPAVLVTSLAAVEKLKQSCPWAIEHCISTAGFSVGEFAALVFSGAISFQDAVRLIKIRAEAMQQASVETPSGMMTVFLTHKTKLNYALLTARRYCSTKLEMENPVCVVANYLYPECKVIAGHNEALDFIEKYGRDFNIARTQRLPVSGAFHTPIMLAAGQQLAEALSMIDMNKPIIPTHSNVTSLRYRNPAMVRKLLVQQLFNPVKWEQVIHVLFSRPEGEQFPVTFELGPGKQLGGILRRINKKAFTQYETVSV